MSNLTAIDHGEARPEMDETLRRYFQSEMPHPWPAFKAPRTASLKPTASLWSRSAGRLALAASLAALIFGYLALGAFFPRLQAPSGVEKVSPDAASKQKLKANKPAQDDVNPALMP